MYKASIQDKIFQIEHKEGSLFLEGSPIDLDQVKLADGSTHIIHQNKSHKIHLIEFNTEEKSIELLINNKPITVHIQDKMDLLLKKMGIDVNTSAKGGSVKAPMPGLVLDIKVETDTEVQKGDPLLILEAMKMENIIKSPADGKIISINVKQGQAVEKNQVLIELS